ncbi:MAG: Lrp/AsnC family transcriptional regulator [Comamonadaceae bacterium]|nr:MAG: Lrp/AsnC family transcriptional regulator [Comamonadaceae bacterium]
MKDYSINAVDLRLLDLLQTDANRTNQDLAAVANISPATCLRRVQRLRSNGLIESTVAHLAPGRLAQALGHGLQAVTEISLDRQDAGSLQAFEDRAVAEAAVQQCHRVSPGPDFVLIVAVADMPGYQALAQRLFTADANVRNVKTFFSLKRAKFSARLPLPLPGRSEAP